jgi:hypothetical protein
MKKAYIKPEAIITVVDVEHFITAGSDGFQSTHRQSGLFTDNQSIEIYTGSADVMATGGQSDDGSGNRAKGNTIWDSWDEE